MASPVFTSGGFGLGGGNGGLQGPSRNVAGIELTGTKELIDALNALGPRMLEKGKLALREIAEDVITRAVEKAPQRTGDLRATGHANDVTVEGEALSVTMGFGGTAPSGGNVNYAVYVHEDLTKRHDPPYGKGGEAKFLEKAILEVAPRMEAHMASILRDELARMT